MPIALANLDHAVLGGLAATLGVYLVSVARRCFRVDAWGWLRWMVTSVLLLLSLEVQLSVLLLLLGADATQDGLLNRDVRLRNVAALAALAAVWGGALIARVRRTADDSVLQSAAQRSCE